MTWKAPALPSRRADGIAIACTRTEHARSARRQYEACVIFEIELANFVVDDGRWPEQIQVPAPIGWQARHPRHPMITIALTVKLTHEEPGGLERGIAFGAAGSEARVEGVNGGRH